MRIDCISFRGIDILSLSSLSTISLVCLDFFVNFANLTPLNWFSFLFNSIKYTFLPPPVRTISLLFCCCCCDFSSVYIFLAISVKNLKSHQSLLKRCHFELEVCWLFWFCFQLFYVSWDLVYHNDMQTQRYYLHSISSVIKRATLEYVNQ